MNVCGKSAYFHFFSFDTQYLHSEFSIVRLCLPFALDRPDFTPECMLRLQLPTMSAKSLGTLPVDEQLNPLPPKTMFFEGDTNSTGGRNDVFPSS